MTTAGQRAKRVTVQPWAGTISNGINAPAWGTGFQRWAEVRSISGQEFDAGNRIVSEATHVFLFPKPSTVTLKDRLVWDSLYWDVVHVDTTDRDVVKVMAKSGQRIGN